MSPPGHRPDYPAELPALLASGLHLPVEVSREIGEADTLRALLAGLNLLLPR